VRTSKDGWGAVAGPRATDPSRIRNSLPCHGHTGETFRPASREPLDQVLHLDRW
jgi:hypothetical protein